MEDFKSSGGPFDSEVAEEAGRNQYLPASVHNYIPSELLEIARELRKNQTKAEVILWELLRNRRLNGLKFRRQHPLHEGIVIDFFCAQARLAIEVEGAYHRNEEQQIHDQYRTALLQEYGIRVLRFWNDEVYNDTARVLNEILQACRT